MIIITGADNLVAKRTPIRGADTFAVNPFSAHRILALSSFKVRSHLFTFKYSYRNLS
jgi:hypothetical protein